MMQNGKTIFYGSPYNQLEEVPPTPKTNLGVQFKKDVDEDEKDGTIVVREDIETKKLFNSGIARITQTQLNYTITLSQC